MRLEGRAGGGVSLTVGTFAALSEAGSAGATLPGPNGKIAYADGASG